MYVCVFYCECIQENSAGFCTPPTRPSGLLLQLLQLLLQLILIDILITVRKGGGGYYETDVKIGTLLKSHDSRYFRPECGTCVYYYYQRYQI